MSDLQVHLVARQRPAEERQQGRTLLEALHERVDRRQVVTGLGEETGPPPDEQVLGRAMVHVGDRRDEGREEAGLPRTHTRIDQP